MEEIKDERSARSNLPEEDDINMEQADYERDSDTEEEKNPPGLPLDKRPKSKAMPTQPSVPPLKLTPKIKAQPKNDLDEETEFDNYQTNKADRPPLPLRPTTSSIP